MLYSITRKVGHMKPGGTDTALYNIHTYTHGGVKLFQLLAQLIIVMNANFLPFKEKPISDSRESVALEICGLKGSVSQDFRPPVFS